MTLNKILLKRNKHNETDNGIEPIKGSRYVKYNIAESYMKAKTKSLIENNNKLIQSQAQKPNINENYFRIEQNMDLHDGKHDRVKSILDAEGKSPNKTSTDLLNQVKPEKQNTNENKFGIEQNVDLQDGKAESELGQVQNEKAKMNFEPFKTSRAIKIIEKVDTEALRRSEAAAEWHAQRMLEKGLDPSSYAKKKESFLQVTLKNRVNNMLKPSNMKIRILRRNSNDPKKVDVPEEDVKLAAHYLNKANEAYDSRNYMETEQYFNYALELDPSVNGLSYLDYLKAQSD